MVGIGEILNYISLSILSENFQSFFALILFILLLIKFLKDKPVLFFLCLSSPLIIKYIFTQKPFLIPSLLFALTAYIVFVNKNNENLSKQKIIFILGKYLLYRYVKIYIYSYCFFSVDLFLF